MTHPHGWPGWHPPSPYPMPGQMQAAPFPFEVAMMLGRLEASSERQTEILLAINERLIDLPDRLAARLPSSPASPQPSPPPPPAAPSLKLGTIREWILAATAIGALIAVATGRMTWLQLFDLARKLAGAG